MAFFVRIMVLRWADMLTTYTMFMMQTYLTNVWKLSFTHANGILNIWNGVTLLLPIGFLHLVDTFLGHFRMILLSSIAYSVGMGFLYMSTPPVLASSLDTCKDYEPNCICGTQNFLFYTALALLAVGISGYSVSLKRFLDVQQEFKFDIDDSNKIYFKILHMVMVMVVIIVPPIIGAIVLPRIQPWSIRFGIPAICTAVATLLFWSSLFSLFIEIPQGSPLTKVCRVLVASTFKTSQQFPLDDKELYREDGPEHQSFSHTRVLREGCHHIE